MHDEIAPLALQFERELLDGVSDEDREKLGNIIDQLLKRARMLDKN